MSHYFSKQPTTKSNPQAIEFHYHNHKFVFNSDRGVFSKDHVDFATQLLIESVEVQKNQKVLDLGCGYGVIGIVLSKITPLELTMIDVNQRALELTNQNLLKHGVNAEVIESDGFEKLTETYDHIITNPPIRIGKTSLYKLFFNAKSHLKPKGILWIVMHKKHGVLSAVKYLNELYTVNTVIKQKGFHVIACHNLLTN